MNYIWDYILKAEELGLSDKDIRFQPAKLYSPYMELSFEDLNKDDFTDKTIEINPYYRYYKIFKDLFHPDNNESMQFREEVFDILVHHLLNTDRYMGMNREEFYVRFLRKDLEAGCLGNTLKKKFVTLDKGDSKLFLHKLLCLYKIGDSVELFREVMGLFYSDFSMYENSYAKEELLIYLGINYTEKEAEKIQLIIDFFMPIRYEYRIYWEYHFGIIGVDETMIMDQIQLY